jgi:hypothetical protein
MADIDDTGAIRWVGEELRPIAERLRDINALMGNLESAWNLEMSTLIGSDAGDNLLDVYQDEVGNRLTAADITAFMGGIANLTTYLGGAGVMDAIHRAAIRPMRVPSGE